MNYIVSVFANGYDIQDEKNGVSVSRLLKILYLTYEELYGLIVKDRYMMVESNVFDTRFTEKNGLFYNKTLVIQMAGK